jgi:hypothetical protein
MTVEQASRDAIVDCAQRCETALQHLAQAEAKFEWELATYWRNRAAWWSEQAFREVHA